MTNGAVCTAACSASVLAPQRATVPNLSLDMREASDTDVTLRVWFELESRPSWASADAAGARDPWVDLDVSREDLRQAARDLRDQLEKVSAAGHVSHASFNASASNVTWFAH